MKLSLQDPLFLTLILMALAIVILVILGFAVFLVAKSLKQKKAAAVEGDLAKSKRWTTATVPGMAESFRAALRRLRDQSPSWSYRYKVPWYVLVGESGSGKSEVANTLSGISNETVETAEQQGDSNYAPRWILLDQAVLIDLPGSSFLSAPPPASTDNLETKSLGESALRRYSPIDQVAWRKFLRLTAHFRPRQPLNGVVLTIPSTDLVGFAGDPEDPRCETRITALANRLDDIQRLLHLSLPIYVLITKCDLVKGFGSFSRSYFEQRLARAEKEDVDSALDLSDDLFGWSNPHALNSAFSPMWVDEAFDDINETLLRRQLEMLAQSRSTKVADDLFLFPFEVQKLHAPLHLLLKTLFRTTAYHSPHLLRGIYFCGRESAPEVAEVSLQPHAWHAERGLLSHGSNALLYCRNLFRFKVFAERCLATPTAGRFFSSNRSVILAQVLACALAILFGVGSVHAWHRIQSLERDHIDPTLESLTSSLNEIVDSSESDVTPAVDLFTTLGSSHDSEYYALAMPYSYVDLAGLHSDLRDTIEGTFESVILSACKRALESRIQVILNTKTAPVPAADDPGLAYPSGEAWSSNSAYRDLERYLSDLNALGTNISRYNAISSPDSGGFRQLNDLLHYLGVRDLPNSSRFAKDPVYQRLLLEATWKPLNVSPKYDQLTASATKVRISDFYLSWIVKNPLVYEVQSLATQAGLQALLAVGPASASGTPTNEQLRSIVSRVQAIDTQLKDGSYDWAARPFTRDWYPSTGPKLDAMPFADSSFTDDITSKGTQALSKLHDGLMTTPAIVDLSDGTARLDDQVRTLASVLGALLGNELMKEQAEETGEGVSCHLIPAGYVWNTDDLNRALHIAALRAEVESDLIPELPTAYRDGVQNIVDRRTVLGMFAALQKADVANPNQANPQTALDAELQNLSQSLDRLQRIRTSFLSLHGTSESSCLSRSLTRQANSLLTRINQRLPGLYSPTATTSATTGDTPFSQWLYGVSSADDLQSYLASQRQQIETLSTSVEILIPLLGVERNQADLETKWLNVTKDVAAFQAKKADNPIQVLEMYISTDLDKITPEEGCKAPALRRSNDVFIRVGAALSNSAVNHCYVVTIARFNEIAEWFNQKLAGRFPFSKLLDTRPGFEAEPSAVAAFYGVFDRDSPGLQSALPLAAQSSQEAVEFLQAMTAARSLVLGSAKSPTPALGVTVRFRTDHDHEVYGNRIAEWVFNVGQQSTSFPPDPGDLPPRVWQFGDPVELTLRYANNSPQVPATANPSPEGHVQGAVVEYRYVDSWSLFTFLRDHAPTVGASSGEYTVRIPNVNVGASSNTAAPPDTVVHFQIDLLPIGAKPGGATLPFPLFPDKASIVALKAIHGE